MAEFLNAEGPPSDALLKSAIRLARLDTIYRSSTGFEYLDAPIAEMELAELRALFLGIKPHEWRTEGPCILNPTFGIASYAIGGADADAIVGGLLVDVKSTKNLTLTLGVKNALDTNPPFTNSNLTFQSGYDPSYYDARARLVYGSVRYSFK